MVEYENSVKAGTNVLGYEGDVYDPSGEQEAAAHSQVLGGSSRITSSADSMEDRRRRVVEAAEKRLRQEEEDMENSCGTAGPSAVSE